LFILAFLAQRRHRKVQKLSLPIALERDACLADGRVFLPGSADQRPQLHRQAIPRQLQQVHAGLARRGFKVRSRPSPELDHFHRTVDNHSDRGIVLQHHTIRLGLHFLFISRRGRGLQQLA
jgi:hypothetical protein